MAKFAAHSEMKSLLRILTILALSLTALPVAAQSLTDSAQTHTIPDTIPAQVEGAGSQMPIAPSLVKPLPFQPNPKKSALFSAILPGAGQFYNRQYWKIPIIYAGVGAAVYFLVDNTRQYRRFREGYIARITNPNVQDDFTGRYSQQDLQVLQNAYRKYLDMTMLFTGLGYTLQVMDALTFAHLKNFDISKDISIRMHPVALPNGAPGLGFVMRF
ncbi:MAG: hypothetical protein JST06_02960 [Bacteroidetes bacterium]|nr:hypothetical protein [Bacteroidota bacterium]MBS1630264.1 hypothetical protein [Bacteroidota bacterium]